MLRPPGRARQTCHWSAWIPRPPVRITTPPECRSNPRPWWPWRKPCRNRPDKKGRFRGQNGRDDAEDPARQERRHLRRRLRARLKQALLGRPRGGSTCKAHLASERRCRPLSIVVSAGQAAGSPRFIPVLEKVRVQLPVAHDTGLYKDRNTVERMINKLKAWRGIATRYDKKPESYDAGLHLRASTL